MLRAHLGTSCNFVMPEYGIVHFDKVDRTLNMDLSSISSS